MKIRRDVKPFVYEIWVGVKYMTNTKIEGHSNTWRTMGSLSCGALLENARFPHSSKVFQGCFIKLRRKKVLQYV